MGWHLYKKVRDVFIGGAGGGGRGGGQIKYKAEVPPRTMVMKKDIKNISCFIDQHISH